jgi:protocatechuate 3,4-dioxygenase beta subunit
MSQLTRRAALSRVSGVALAAAALGRVTGVRAQDLGAFSAGPAPCAADEKATPAVPEAEFKAGSPQRSSLVPAGETASRLVLSGSVSGLSCGAIKNARLEFWQADRKGQYDRAGFGYRGHQFTDATGVYRLETIVPGAHNGQAPRIYVRVEPPGKPAFSTALFFPHQPGNQTDPRFRKELVLAIAEGRGTQTARFDIVLNL